MDALRLSLLRLRKVAEKSSLRPEAAVARGFASFGGVAAFDVIRYVHN